MLSFRNASVHAGRSIALRVTLHRVASQPANAVSLPPFVVVVVVVAIRYAIVHGKYRNVSPCSHSFSSSGVLGSDALSAAAAVAAAS